MPLPRLHLFEFEDQPWFPAIWRDAMTGYLRHVEGQFQLYRHALQPLDRILAKTGSRQIVDLCSGAAGPLPPILKHWSAQGRRVAAVLTDLFPNADAFRNVVEDSGGLISSHAEPVDAARVPAALAGLRTIFNGFHHFRPPAAQAVLADAVRARQPIAVFEVADRNLAAIAPLALVPLVVWIMTPAIRPFRWSRLFWTYVLPVLPVVIQWDGVVSYLRAYTPAELLELAKAVEPETYAWVSGYSQAAKVPGRMTYLLGTPL